jgi:hypothetical protein
MRGGRNMGERGQGQGKAIQAKHLWSPYSPGPRQDLHSGARETHSTSRFRYRYPEWQAAGG